MGRDGAVVTTRALPNKVVVLVIHGLMDSPSTWAPMIINLRSDPEIRKYYQFWFYSYPSRYPYPYTASILREILNGVEKRFSLHKPMVVIGHSMGGCISRLLITDMGETLWERLFNHTPAETRLLASSRKLYTDALIFKHREEIGRVIFISSPLKGSCVVFLDETLGVIAQLVERLHGMEEVWGSTPHGSTKYYLDLFERSYSGIKT